jgi:hypothetical protein
MRRVIGMDIHRTFAEVVFWEDGKLRPAGRISMTRAGLEGFGRSLGKEDGGGAVPGDDPGLPRQHADLGEGPGVPTGKEREAVLPSRRPRPLGRREAGQARVN